MRAPLIAFAVALAPLAAAPAASAGTIDAGVVVFGSVAERGSSEKLDSFRTDSRDTGLHDLSGEAVDTEMQARAGAEAAFATGPTTGGERLTASGRSSARSGTPTPRESDATSNLTAQFTLTEPADYTMSGTLTGTGPAGQCCSSAVATLRDEDGNKLVNEIAKIGDSPTTIGAGGTLPPGEYTLSIEANTGLGFGSAASDASGSASYDVTFTLGLPDADTDGDALPDTWETDGVDVDGNGSIDLDLPGMGADPRHKDLFVELDFMPPHRFTAGAAALIADAFADAPVNNPDGKPGIALHLDNGADSVMNPKTGATWGSRTRQSALVHQNGLGTVTGDTYDWTAFDGLRSAAFPTERRTAFRYAISGHGHDGRVSGVARGIPSSDLLVTLGAGCAHISGGTDCTLDAMAQAGTLMHELGHTLGLRHGGADDLLDKPNHLSVMNYSFQLTGLQDSSGARSLDYSRFSIPFDERALDETVGFGITAVPPADLLTLGRCPDGTRVAWPIRSGPVDFNCDRAFGPVSTDTNGDGLKTALAPFTEWPALAFAGGSVGGAGATPPATSPRSEPPLDELVAAKAALDAALPKPGGGSGTPPPSSGGTGPAPVTPRPALTALSVRRGRIAYTLSAPARVRFTVQRLLPGHRRAGRCRAGGRGPRCVRAVRLRGSFSHQGRTGTNRLRLPKRVGGRTLKPGRYRLAATPAGGTARRAAFRLR
jgi:hypothetical protein